MDDTLVPHHGKETDGEGEEADHGQDAEFDDGGDTREVLRGREGGRVGGRGGERKVIDCRPGDVSMT